MRKLAFRYRKIKEIYNAYRNNPGSEFYYLYFYIILFAVFFTAIEKSRRFTTSREITALVKVVSTSY
jgi:hypothetical protein